MAVLVEPSQEIVFSEKKTKITKVQIAVFGDQKLKHIYLPPRYLISSPSTSSKLLLNFTENKFRSSQKQRKKHSKKQKIEKRNSTPCQMIISSFIKRRKTFKQNSVKLTRIHFSALSPSAKILWKTYFLNVALSQDI